MRIFWVLLIVSVFLLSACEENQLTGSVVNEGACIDTHEGLYDNPSCNLNCKAGQSCQSTLVEGKSCYECHDLVQTQDISCWNGAILAASTTPTNKTRFALNQTNATGIQPFCVDDCPPDMICNPTCKCVKAPPPKITCDKVKQKANGQPLFANKNCDGKCPPQLCKAYNIPGTQPALICYACVQPECPPPTRRLRDCQITCGRGYQCVPRLAVGGQACYSCDPFSDTPQEKIDTQLDSEKLTQEDTTVETSGAREQAVDCNSYCAKQSMSPSLPDYSSYLRSYLTPYSCVSSARIGIRTTSYANCKCSPNQPEVTLDRTPPICKGTPCGDVPCGQSKDCSCGERCTTHVSCDWGGWQIGAQSATPIVG